MAILLSAQCGELVTPEQLLGEPEPDPAERAQTVLSAAEERLKAMQAQREVERGG